MNTIKKVKYAITETVAAVYTKVTTIENQVGSSDIRFDGSEARLTKLEELLAKGAWGI